MITGSNGQFVVSAKHVFPKFSGAKAVTVTVFDAQGRSGNVREAASHTFLHPKVPRATPRVKVAANPHR